MYIQNARAAMSPSTISPLVASPFRPAVARTSVVEALHHGLLAQVDRGCLEHTYGPVLAPADFSRISILRRCVSDTASSVVLGIFHESCRGLGEDTHTSWCRGRDVRLGVLPMLQQLLRFLQQCLYPDSVSTSSSLLVCSPPPLALYPLLPRIRDVPVGLEQRADVESLPPP